MEPRTVHVLIELCGDCLGGAVLGVFSTEARAKAAMEARPDIANKMAVVAQTLDAPILPEGLEVGGLHVVQLPRGRKRPTYKTGGVGPRHPSEVSFLELGGVVEVCSPISFEHAEAEARRYWDERKAERKARRS
jgi:hypothetical protein